MSLLSRAGHDMGQKEVSSRKRLSEVRGVQHRFSEKSSIGQLGQNKEGWLAEIKDVQTISLSLRLPQNPFLPIILIKLNLLAASALLNYKLHEDRDGKVLIQCQVSVYNTHYYYHYYYFFQHTKYAHFV